jgi:hypothetical protein
MQRGSTRVICILQTQRLFTIHSFLVERVQTTLINQQDHRRSVSGVLHQPLPLRCSFHKVEGFTPTTAVQGGSLVQTCQSISCGNATCSQYLSICNAQRKRVHTPSQYVSILYSPHLQQLKHRSTLACTAQPAD